MLAGHGRIESVYGSTLTQSTRKSTSDNYNIHWKNWVVWCLSRNPKKGPLHYDPLLVVEYLVSLSSLSLQHLNVVRSAIASVYRVVHAQEPSLGNDVLIQQFFKARKRTRNKLPNRNQDISDIDPILILVENWGVLPRTFP